jgi:hypothetical protein
MESSAQLAARLYAEQIDRARGMDPGEKLLEGPRLFERACRLIADGIRHERPDLDDVGVHALLLASLDRVRALDQS